MDEYVDLISNCNACIKKTTTSGCFTCEVYKIKTTITEIQNEIIKIKNNRKLWDYCIFIDCKYFDMITNIIDFHMMDVYKRDLDYLLPQKNIVAILYNKKELSSDGNNDIFATII